MFNKDKRRLIDFVDLGSVNRNISKMKSVSEEETEASADMFL